MGFDRIFIYKVNWGWHDHKDPKAWGPFIYNCIKAKAAERSNLTFNITFFQFRHT